MAVRELISPPRIHQREPGVTPPGDAQPEPRVHLCPRSTYCTYESPGAVGGDLALLSSGSLSPNPAPPGTLGTGRKGSALRAGIRAQASEVSYASEGQILSSLKFWYFVLQDFVCVFIWLFKNNTALKYYSFWLQSLGHTLPAGVASPASP